MGFSARFLFSLALVTISLIALGLVVAVAGCNGTEGVGLLYLLLKLAAHELPLLFGVPIVASLALSAWLPEMTRPGAVKKCLLGGALTVSCFCIAVGLTMLLSAPPADCRIPVIR